jgi:thiol:disulfide interchange protein
MWAAGTHLWQTENSCGGQQAVKIFKLLALALLVCFVAGPARSADRIIYPETSQANADLTAALKTAASEHKRILLDFGGNWCGDCQVLDIYFHDPSNLPILNKNFVLVHINVGHTDENLDIARRFGVPLEKGVPALAVLSEHGKLLYSQKQGEFEAMRHMESSSVTSFLVQWRPQHSGCSAVVVNC